jgi:hypothetical protein
MIIKSGKQSGRSSDRDLERAKGKSFVKGRASQLRILTALYGVLLVLYLPLSRRTMNVGVFERQTEPKETVSVASNHKSFLS